MVYAVTLLCITLTDAWRRQGVQEPAQEPPVDSTSAFGSIFGIGTVTRGANTRIVSEIVLSWVLTLPLAALLGAAAYGLLTALA